MEKNKLLNTDFLLRVTGNGELYYKVKLGNVRKKDEHTFANISSPFRNDRKPSMSIYRNRDNNKWLFKDFGDSSLGGDMFKFASLTHKIGYDHFPLVLEAIWEDLKLEQVPCHEIENFIEGREHNINFNHLIRDYRDSQSAREKGEPEYGFELLKKDPISLSFEEQRWLKCFGISTEAMHNTKASFIGGYIKRFTDGSIKESRKPEGHVWVAYEFGRFAKIYSPNPKKFWYIGQKTSNWYLFGHLGPNETPTNTLLVGGEKDVLTLRSHNIPAICLNSETAALSARNLKDLYQDNVRIHILYDNDPTGQEEAKKLNATYNLPIIDLPPWVREKGGKDISDFFANGGTAEEITELIKRSEFTPSSNKTNPKLRVRTANQRIADAKNQPDILPHFDVLFQRNELAILFGDTGRGKSILAVAIADAISKGVSLWGLENAYGPLKVLFFDFELGDKQFEKRYRDEMGNNYEFSSNLFLDHLDLSSIPTNDKKIKFEEALMERITEQIEATQAEVLVLDNITFLSTETAEYSEVALTLMKLLKSLKTKMNISILVLAHTPKKYHPGGINVQDVAGSKHLVNFVDNVVGLGQSQKDPAIKYLIQPKPSRSGEAKYDTNNVVLCEIEKVGAMLTLGHRGYAKEIELLRQSDDQEDELIAKAKEFDSQGKSYREIAVLLGVSKSRVGRWIKPS